MPRIFQQDYYIYITTNPSKTVLYTGVTNNLSQRIIEHWMKRGKDETFAGKYYCYNLIYYEQFQDIRQAIARENEIKGWRRQKKLDLIKMLNPGWIFYNATVCDGWPPREMGTRF